VEEGDLVRIHPASINCQFHVFPKNFEEVGVGVTHRSGVGVCSSKVGNCDAWFGFSKKTESGVK
jgi:hypothetical protein